MTRSFPRAPRAPLLGTMMLLAGAALAQPAKPIQLIAQQPPSSRPAADRTR